MPAPILEAAPRPGSSGNTPNPIAAALFSRGPMSLRRQQIAVFVFTLLAIFGLFASVLWLVAHRLVTEATIQTSLLLARQVEIALADSLRTRTAGPAPQSAPWAFLDRLFPRRPTPSSSRGTEVRGLMRAYVDRSRSIEAMWVLNQDGKILYASTDRDDAGVSNDASLRENLRRGATTIASRRVDGATYYDVLVPLQMPKGARGPGGLRLWINPADWTELLSGLWRQLALLFVLAAGVAVGGAYLITTLYTRRFRLIRDTLRQAAAGTYRSRPPYASRDEVAASLDLIDRLVMKQRGAAASPTPLQRLAVAARALAHEVRTPLNALAVHLQLLGQADGQGSSAIPDRRERSLAAADASIRQVEQLVRDFTDYSAPAAMERERLDVSAVLAATLDAMKPVCAGRGIDLARALPLGPWPLTGDATRLRQIFDNLLRNALEALPNGGTIRVEGRMEEGKIILDFADTGPGIPPERRPALFDFGRSTKPGGSGIGLPLSQLIAEAHGGTLSYVADDGSSRGALFRLQLPLEPTAQ